MKTFLMAILFATSSFASDYTIFEAEKHSDHLIVSYQTTKDQPSMCFLSVESISLDYSDADAGPLTLYVSVESSVAPNTACLQAAGKHRGTFGFPLAALEGVEEISVMINDSNIEEVIAVEDVL